MKKLLSLLLAMAITVSVVIIPVAADAPTFSVSSSINLSKSGFKPGDDAFHGNHQNRVVHTSHGDYAAYITGTYTDSKGQTVNKWSLFKVDTKANTSTVIFTGEKYYDSSQVSLIVDKNENVWAITSTSDSRRNLTAEGIDARAHRLDAVTGEVTSYESIIGGGAQDGYGYATCFYDAKYDRIIVMHAGGDYVEGQKRASLNWTIFSLKTNTWQTRVRYTMIDARHCYMFGYADGNGGLVMIAQRDIKAASLGYPEVGSNEGLTSSDYQYMSQNGITRWAANYCWDQLDLYYFPKITESTHYTYSVCEADYSKVTGTQSQRYTLSYRLNNYYPAAQNNNGGDFLLSETADGKKLLHITYNKALIQAAMDRSKGCESKWYHQVWDVTDGRNAVKLYDGVLVDEISGESGYSFRLYEDSLGNVYLISGHNGKLYIYRAEYNGTGGYNYHLVSSAKSISGLSNLIHISSHRSGSVTDNTLNVLYSNSGNYHMAQITLDTVEYTPVECNHIWIFSESESRAATCTATGTNVYRCTYCNDAKTETTEALGHSLVPSELAPTCTEDGYSKLTCSVCNRHSTTVIPATGHSLAEKVTEATCTRDGEILTYCTVCSNYSTSEVIPATGHSYNSGTCSSCGDPDPDYVDILFGDVNNDGTVNSKDSFLLLRYILAKASTDGFNFDAADIDGNGKINATDSNKLKRIIAGLQ